MPDLIRHPSPPGRSGGNIKKNILTFNYAEKKGREESFAEGCAEGHAKGKAEGREEGFAEGKAEGAEQTRIETARRMVRELGFTVEQATRVTGLSPEQVRALM